MSTSSVHVYVSDTAGGLTSADWTFVAIGVEGTPNLVVTEISNPPASAAIGSTFIVEDTTKNVGEFASGPSRTRFYLAPSNDPSFNPHPNKALAGFRSIAPRQPGERSVSATTVTVLDHFDSGVPHYLWACADASNGVAEAFSFETPGNDMRERDNCRASSSTVTITP